MQSPAPKEMQDWNPRSMGMKLLLLSVLALFMTVPSFFVSNLAKDRSQIAAHGTISVPSTVTNAPSSVPLIRTVDSYRSVTRSLKYVLLFLGLLFLTYFIFEATTGTRVHPAQYVLVGTAQLIFYLLLLSLAEKVGFDWAFLVAGGATVCLLSTNAGWIFESRMQGWRALSVFGPLYTLIYLLLRLEDDALLIGAIMSFLAVAVAMYFTRKIDWYSARSSKERPRTSNGPEFFQGLV